MTTYYDIGDLRASTAIFTNTSGVPTNPTNVTVAVYPPSGGSLSYTWPASGSITNPGAGTFVYNLNFTEAGAWEQFWTGSGTVTAAEPALTYWVRAAPPVLRPGMSGLIAQLRRLTGDQAGTTQAFTDAECQSFLDERRQLIIQKELCWIPTYSGGSVVYVQASVDWPGTYPAASAGLAGTIVDYTGSTVGSWQLTFDGLVTFTTNQAGSLRYFNGTSYDVYGAAADFCRAWAGQYALRFDFESDGQVFRRSQVQKALLDRAATLESQSSVVRVGQLVRTD